MDFTLLNIVFIFIKILAIGGSISWFSSEDELCFSPFSYPEGTKISSWHWPWSETPWSVLNCHQCIVLPMLAPEGDANGPLTWTEWRGLKNGRNEVEIIVQKRPGASGPTYKMAPPMESVINTSCWCGLTDRQLILGLNAKTSVLFWS